MPTFCGAQKLPTMYTSSERTHSSSRTARSWPSHSPGGLNPRREKNHSSLPLPIRRHVILQKVSPYLLAGVQTGDDGIEDARRTVHGIERWMKAMFGELARGEVGRVFVRHPTCVHGVHVNAIRVIFRRGGACHHIERSLGHVGVRMARGLEFTIELPLDSGDVHDVFVPLDGAKHQRL